MYCNIDFSRALRTIRLPRHQGTCQAERWENLDRTQNECSRSPTDAVIGDRIDLSNTCEKSEPSIVC